MVNDAAQQRIALHVVTKNLQSIRSESRFGDFCMELGHCEYDVCLLNETWKSNEDTYTLPRGDCIFLSGGEGNGGVGIAVSGRLMAAIIARVVSCLLRSGVFAEIFICWIQFSFLVVLFPNFMGR